MSQNDKNMIAGTQESFATAAKEIGVTITGLQVINTTAEEASARDLASDALAEALQAETHLANAKAIINGQRPDEPSMAEVFLKVSVALHDLKDFVADEFSATEDTELLPELDAANWLIGDAIEIIERAKMRAEGTLKGQQTARVFLTTMGEYFTFDHTTPKLRYTGIPQEHRH